MSVHAWSVAGTKATAAQCSRCMPPVVFLLTFVVEVRSSLLICIFAVGSPRPCMHGSYWAPRHHLLHMAHGVEECACIGGVCVYVCLCLCVRGLCVWKCCMTFCPRMLRVGRVCGVCRVVLYDSVSSHAARRWSSRLCPRMLRYCEVGVGMGVWYCIASMHAECNGERMELCGV